MPRKKEAIKTSDIITGVKNKISTRKESEFCSFYFELKDNKKIMSRFNDKALYIKDKKFYAVCKNKAEKGYDKCKKHLTCDLIVRVESLKLVENIEDITDVKNIGVSENLSIVITSELKKKCEAILKNITPKPISAPILKKDDKSKTEDLLSKVNDKDEDDELKIIEQICRSASDVSEESEYSDDDCSEYSEESCRSIIVDGRHLYINRLNELIEIDSFGIGTKLSASH